MGDEKTEAVEEAPATQSTGAAALASAGKWLRPTTPQGWLAAVVAALFTLNVFIDIGRSYGIDDSKYPFATQAQIQLALDQMDAQALRQNVIGKMVCDLVTATGGSPPAECATFTGMTTEPTP